MTKQIIANFLKQLRRTSGLSANEVTNKLQEYDIDISAKTLYGYESGLSMLNADAFVALCRIYKCDNPLEIFGTPTVKSNEMEIIEKYRNLDPAGQSHVDSILDWETARITALKEKDKHITELEARPATIIELDARSGLHHLAEYFHDASAGGGIFILGNEATSKIAVSDSDWDERTDYVIRVNGDSMMPDYIDGDNVMVSQHTELNYGDVGIFVINGKAYIKEYSEAELISRNPKSPNIPIHEFDNIVCMGKVIGKLKGGYKIIGG